MHLHLVLHEERLSLDGALDDKAHGHLQCPPSTSVGTYLRTSLWKSATALPALPHHRRREMAHFTEASRRKVRDMEHESIKHCRLQLLSERQIIEEHNNDRTDTATQAMEVAERACKKLLGSIYEKMKKTQIAG